MPDENQNMIPDKLDKILALVFAILLGALGLMVEGQWFGSDATIWLQRAILLCGFVSSIFGWGIWRRPGG